MVSTKEEVRKGVSGQQKAGRREEHSRNENSGCKSPGAEASAGGGGPPHHGIHGTKINLRFQE